MTREDIKLILKAFYKVNDIERKVHGEQSAYEYSQTMEYYDDILMHYYDLKGKSPLPPNLDEAACNHIRKVAYAAGHPGWEWETQDIAEAFKAGAEWMAGQGVKADCVESCNPVSYNEDERLHLITLVYAENENTPHVLAGDKVEIILRKKQ